MTGAATAIFPRELVLASAGTGKTFRISSRIIGLLASGSRADAVFASTFTRKAAGEILDRVLARLAAAALDPEQAAALAEHAALTPGSLEEWGCGAWLELLRRVLGDLHRLNIGTLDAFFIRAATSFADEAALPPGWSVADAPTAERIRGEALGAVLAGADTGEMTELVRGVSGKDAARSVHDALLDRAEALLALHHAIDPAADGPWSAFDRLASAPLDDLADRREALARAFTLAELPRTAKGTPDGRWVTALAKIVRLVDEGDWDQLVCDTLLGAAQQPGGEYCRRAIPEEIQHLAREVFEVAARVLARRFAAQCRAMRRLAEHLVGAQEAAQRALGAYEFGDVTRLLGGDHPLCERPDLHYRLDARVRHVLLDEFQDTSLDQWEALQPLIDSLIDRPGDDGAAVVVADPKQSIYGWRGGEPLLVEHVGERYSLTRSALAVSYRSSPTVLDLLDRVFTSIEENPLFDDDPPAREAAAGWKQTFAKVEAHRKEMPGHVRVVVGPDDATRGNDRPLLCRRAARLVAELHAQAPGRSIGVLTRTNPAVARMMLELRNLGVPASEEGGNPLTDSAAVVAVLSLFRLCDHPGDGISRYHVAKTPLGRVVGLTDPDDVAAARRVARKLRVRLVELGYGRTINEIVAAVVDECEPRDRRRLSQLVEMGYRFDPRATLRATDFVRLVEAERVDDPTSATVRVMTVHQSKGLEFDIVVLPELDGPLTKTHTKELYYRPTPAGRVTRVFPYVKKEVRSVFAEIAELGAAADQIAAAQWRDALSGLYVALSRARHAVHIVVKADGERGMGQTKSAARLLRHALELEGPAAEGRVLFESGDPRWHESLPPRAGQTPTSGEGAAADAAPLRIELRASGRAGKALPRVTPSSLGGGRVDLRGVLRLERNGAERGTLAHAWFERIGWMEDGVPSDDELREIATRVVPGFDAPRVEQLRLAFRSWLARPAIRFLLHRSSFPDGATVEREVPFLHRSEGRMVEGVMDRLVLIREAGRVARAEIVDYKTDSLPAGDAEALARRIDEYRPQLAAYRAAVMTWYSLPPTAVTARLTFLDSGVVAEV